MDLGIGYFIESGDYSGLPRLLKDNGSLLCLPISKAREVRFHAYLLGIIAV